MPDRDHDDDAVYGSGPAIWSVDDRSLFGEARHLGGALILRSGTGLNGAILGDENYWRPPMLLAASCPLPLRTVSLRI